MDETSLLSSMLVLTFGLMFLASEQAETEGYGLWSLGAVSLTGLAVLLAGTMYVAWC